MNNRYVTVDDYEDNGLFDYRTPFDDINSHEESSLEFKYSEKIDSFILAESNLIKMNPVVLQNNVHTELLDSPKNRKEFQSSKSWINNANFESKLWDIEKLLNFKTQ